MLKKIANFLFSTRLTAFLFLAFAIAMEIGTFLDVGQETSPEVEYTCSSVLLL